MIMMDDSTGSQTITAEQDDADGDDRGEGSSTGGNVVGVLKLRGAHAEPRQRVTWTDETVDNEFLNRKKSKSVWMRSVCLGHPPYCC